MIGSAYLYIHKYKDMGIMCNNEVKIVNPRQVARYMKYGFMPLRIELGYSDTLVFVYNKYETAEIFMKWVRHEI